MTDAEIEAVLLEKQRARKRVNRRNFYARHKHDPSFMARVYRDIRNYRERKKAGLFEATP
jgi:hypothetical protein